MSGLDATPNFGLQGRREGKELFYVTGIGEDALLVEAIGTAGILFYVLLHWHECEITVLSMEKYYLPDIKIV